MKHNIMNVSTNMVTKVDLASRLSNLEDSVLRAVSIRHHDYVAEFATALELTTTPLECTIGSSVHYSTEHSIIYNDYVFTVGVKHSRCYKHSGIDIYELYSSDVVFRLGCPVANAVLNVTNFVSLRTGDEASTLGFVQGSSRFWNGRLSGRLGVKSMIGNIQFDPDEYLFEGVTQINGMSGGAALNGVGYTGMVHGISSFGGTGQHLAVVIPAKTIFDGFLSMSVANKVKYMKKLSDCTNITIIQIPAY